jgi:hypothetical protein
MAPGEYAWDATVTVFCARRQRSIAVIYLLRYRTLEGR